MTEPDKAVRTPAERVQDIPRITEALQRAVREALWEHKVTGNSVAVWRHGRVVWIPPEEIPVERPPADRSPGE
jgi:hypothetical protein